MKEIEAATSILDLGIREITSLEMAHAMVKARQRGLKVGGIIEVKHLKLKI